MKLKVCFTVFKGQPIELTSSFGRQGHFLWDSSRESPLQANLRIEKNTKQSVKKEILKHGNLH